MSREKAIFSLTNDFVESNMSKFVGLLNTEVCEYLARDEPNVDETFYISDYPSKL